MGTTTTAAAADDNDGIYVTKELYMCFVWFVVLNEIKYVGLLGFKTC